MSRRTAPDPANGVSQEWSQRRLGYALNGSRLPRGHSQSQYHWGIAGRPFAAWFLERAVLRCVGEHLGGRAI